MARDKTVRILDRALDTHPALLAWQEMVNRPVAASRIEILKGNSLADSRQIKRIVCRLVGAGPAGRNVIAKRSFKDKAQIEHSIYTEVLARIPVPSLEYYGMLDDGSEGFRWLFLEDAGGRTLMETDSDHQPIRARWLGQIHVTASQLPAPSSLPDKDPECYLERIKELRDAVLEFRHHLATKMVSLEDLDAILAQLDALETQWDALAAMSQGLPATLIHGDFVLKNACLRETSDGVDLLPFDWGESGWGAPVIDITQVSPTEYLLAVRNKWPWLDLETVHKFARAGRVFRCLDAMYWMVPSFELPEWIHPLNNMRTYSRWLDEAIRTAEL